MLRRRGALLGLLLLIAGACAESPGGPDQDISSPTTGGTSATTAAPSTSARSDVPDVVVRDVATGADVNLRALGLPDQPTLYWFWAPH
jgi:hypothetical protein